jgi:hypothetical protein
MSAEEDRISALLRRVEGAEVRVAKMEEQASDPIQRVKADLRKCKVFSAQFSTMPPHYYDLSLEERAVLLKCTVPQLCKSIIFENTAYDATVVDPATNPRFICVITQYIGEHTVHRFTQYIDSTMSYGIRVIAYHISYIIYHISYIIYHTVSSQSHPYPLLPPASCLLPPAPTPPTSPHSHQPRSTP